MADFFTGKDKSDVCATLEDMGVVLDRKTWEMVAETCIKIDPKGEPVY